MANLSLSLRSFLPNLHPVLTLFFFKKDLWISADKQTLPHSGYHFILSDIGVFQPRSKACSEEPCLNYCLRNIRRLLLSPPPPCFCSSISLKLFEIQHGTEHRAMLNFSGPSCCYSVERPFCTLDKMHCTSWRRTGLLHHRRGSKILTAVCATTPVSLILLLLYPFSWPD